VISAFSAPGKAEGRKQRSNPLGENGNSIDVKRARVEMKRTGR
jgi:hypothetical protein